MNGAEVDPTLTPTSNPGGLAILGSGVVLLKDGKENDPYHREFFNLLSSCVGIWNVPVLQFQPQPVQGPNGLLQQIVAKSSVAAIVLTSPRAAGVLVSLISELRGRDETLHAGSFKATANLDEGRDEGFSVSMLQMWLSKCCFVVGDATAKIVRDAGFRDVRGSHCGNAKALSEFILTQVEVLLQESQPMDPVELPVDPGESTPVVEDRSQVEVDCRRPGTITPPRKPQSTQPLRVDLSSPLLFLCGEVKKNTLPNQMIAAGIPMVETVVYKSVASCPPQLPEHIADQILSGTDTIIFVFFSPRGVLLSFEHLIPNTLHQYHQLDRSRTPNRTAKKVRRLVLAAIGPSTGKTIRACLAELPAKQAPHPSLPSAQESNTDVATLCEFPEIRVCVASKPTPNALAAAIAPCLGKTGD